MTPQLLPCPACERVTALWVEVRPTERLRCPHCGYEVLYQQLSPMPQLSWQVVGQVADAGVAEGLETEWLASRQTIDATAAPPGSRTVNMVDPSAQTIVDFAGEYAGLTSEDPSEPPSTMPATADEPSASAQNDGKSTFQLTTPAGLGRRRRKKRPSPLWSVVQVALGGLAAIPIGLLLVWHLVGVDVGDAAPWVAQYVPWVVPAELRPYQQPPAEFEARRRPLRSSLPVAGGEQLASSETPPGDRDANAGSLPTAQTDAAGNTPAAQPVEAADSSTDVAGQPSTAIANAELHTPLLENTFALIRQATAHVEEWSVAAHKQDVDLRTLAQATYGDLTNLAVVLEKIPPDNPVWRTVRRQLKPLGLLVVEDAQVRRLISEGSRYWVKNQALSKSDGESNSTANRYGLAVIFTVESAEKVVSAQHAWWRVVASSASRLGDPPLEIRIPVDVALGLPEGRPIAQQELFLLGGVQQGTTTAEIEQEAAPTGARFVASYAIGLAE